MLIKINPAFPSYSRMCGMCASHAISILQSHPEVGRNTNQTGFVYYPFFKQLFELVTGFELSDDILEKFKKLPSLEFHPENYVRARFGHEGMVLAIMLRQTHVLYTGPQKVFCLSHTSMDGLGAINAGRNVSMLSPPEFCFNKGVKAYFDIDTLAKNGISVWKQIGDRQTKVFCYNTELRQNAFKIEYSPEYFNEANLLRTHAKLGEALRPFYTHLSNDEFRTVLSSRIKKLVIHEEDDDVSASSSDELDIDGLVIS